MTQQTQSVVYYRIRLDCYIKKHQQYWFDDLSITNLDDGDCILVGPIPDQAALFGILLKIRDLGLTLISVNRIQQE